MAGIIAGVTIPRSCISSSPAFAPWRTRGRGADAEPVSSSLATRRGVPAYIMLPNLSPESLRLSSAGQRALLFLLRMKSWVPGAANNLMDSPTLLLSHRHSQGQNMGRVGEFISCVNSCRVETTRGPSRALTTSAPNARCRNGEEGGGGGLFMSK